MNEQCCDKPFPIWWEMRCNMDVWRCANCGHETEQFNDTCGGR